MESSWAQGLLWHLFLFALLKHKYVILNFFAIILQLLKDFLSTFLMFEPDCGLLKNQTADQPTWLTAKKLNLITPVLVN